ncbi:MAG: FtsX-like permease family protein [Acidobacteriota bacterium]
MRAALARHDPTLPRRDAEALTAAIDRVVSPRRFTLQVLGAFAAVALLLAALGIYGMLAVFVRERRREIGIRMTLGEAPGEVVLRLLARSLALAGVGLALGGAASIAATRWAESLLYGVEATDPATFAAMAALLLAVVLVAAALPAWRAARTDVTRVLTVR